METPNIAMDLHTHLLSSLVDRPPQGDWFEGASFFSWCISETCSSPFTGCNTHISFPDNTVISFSSVVNTAEIDEFASTATVTGVTGPKSLQKPINLAIDTTEVDYEQFEEPVVVLALEFTYVNSKGWNPFYEYDLTNDFHN